MPNLYKTLPVLQVTFSGGLGEYEAKKSEVMAALQKEFPGLKKGFVWFGSLQKMNGAGFSAYISPEKWKLSNIYGDYLVGEVNIRGFNLVDIFPKSVMIDYRYDIVGGVYEAIKDRQIHMLQIKYEHLRYGEQLGDWKLNKSVKKGKKTRSEFIQDVIGVAYEIKEIQDKISEVAISMREEKEFSPKLAGLKSDVEHYDELLRRISKSENYFEDMRDKAAEELEASQKEETSKYLRSLLSGIKIEDQT